MTNDERRMTNDGRWPMDDRSPTTGDRRLTTDASQVNFQTFKPSNLPPLFIGVLVMLLSLAGCGIAPGLDGAQNGQVGGSFSPEAVAESFFEDLGNALRDPKLADDEQRGAWVERLAGYFAPNERDDQRIALREALDSFTNGLNELETNEELKLELKIERLEQVSQAGDHAMIRPVNGAIYVLITRTTKAGVQNLYEETVPLERIIGNNGSVPVVRIGRSWYLTEG